MSSSSHALKGPSFLLKTDINQECKITFISGNAFSVDILVKHHSNGTIPNSTISEGDWYPVGLTFTLPRIVIDPIVPTNDLSSCAPNNGLYLSSFLEYMGSISSKSYYKCYGNSPETGHKPLLRPRLVCLDMSRFPSVGKADLLFPIYHSSKSGIINIQHISFEKELFLKGFGRFQLPYYPNSSFLPIRNDNSDNQRKQTNAKDTITLYRTPSTVFTGRIVKVLSGDVYMIEVDDTDDDDCLRRVDHNRMPKIAQVHLSSVTCCSFTGNESGSNATFAPPDMSTVIDNSKPVAISSAMVGFNALSFAEKHFTFHRVRCVCISYHPSDKDISNNTQESELTQMEHFKGSIEIIYSIPSTGKDLRYVPDLLTFIGSNQCSHALRKLQKRLGIVINESNNSNNVLSYIPIAPLLLDFGLAKLHYNMIHPSGKMTTLLLGLTIEATCRNTPSVYITKSDLEICLGVYDALVEDDVTLRKKWYNIEGHKERKHFNMNTLPSSILQQHQRYLMHGDPLETPDFEGLSTILEIQCSESSDKKPCYFSGVHHPMWPPRYYPDGSLPLNKYGQEKERKIEQMTTTQAHAVHDILLTFQDQVKRNFTRSSFTGPPESWLAERQIQEILCNPSEPSELSLECLWTLVKLWLSKEQTNQGISSSLREAMAYDLMGLVIASDEDNETKSFQWNPINFVRGALLERPQSPFLTTIEGFIAFAMQQNTSERKCDLSSLFPVLHDPMSTFIKRLTICTEGKMEDDGGPLPPHYAPLKQLCSPADVVSNALVMKGRVRNATITHYSTIMEPNQALLTLYFSTVLSKANLTKIKNQDLVVNRRGEISIEPCYSHRAEWANTNIPPNFRRTAVHIFNSKCVKCVVTYDPHLSDLDIHDSESIHMEVSFANYYHSSGKSGDHSEFAKWFSYRPFSWRKVDPLGTADSIIKWEEELCCPPDSIMYFVVNVRVTVFALGETLDEEIVYLLIPNDCPGDGTSFFGDTPEVDLPNITQTLVGNEKTDQLEDDDTIPLPTVVTVNKPEQPVSRGDLGEVMLSKIKTVSPSLYLLLSNDAMVPSYDSVMQSNQVLTTFPVVFPLSNIADSDAMNALKLFIEEQVLHKEAFFIPTGTVTATNMAEDGLLEGDIRLINDSTASSIIKYQAFHNCVISNTIDRVSKASNNVITLLEAYNHKVFTECWKSLQQYRAEDSAVSTDTFSQEVEWEAVKAQLRGNSTDIEMGALFTDDIASFENSKTSHIDWIVDAEEEGVVGLFVGITDNLEREVPMSMSEYESVHMKRLGAVHIAKKDNPNTNTSVQIVFNNNFLMDYISIAPRMLYYCHFTHHMKIVPGDTQTRIRGFSNPDSLFHRLRFPNLPNIFRCSFGTLPIYLRRNPFLVLGNPKRARGLIKTLNTPVDPRRPRKCRPIRQSDRLVSSVDIMSAIYSALMFAFMQPNDTELESLLSIRDDGNDIFENYELERVQFSNRTYVLERIVVPGENDDEETSYFLLGPKAKYLVTNLESSRECLPSLLLPREIYSIVEAVGKSMCLGKRPESTSIHQTIWSAHDEYNGIPMGQQGEVSPSPEKRVFTPHKSHSSEIGGEGPVAGVSTTRLWSRESAGYGYSCPMVVFRGPTSLSHRHFSLLSDTPLACPSFTESSPKRVLVEYHPVRLPDSKKPAKIYALFPYGRIRRDGIFDFFLTRSKAGLDLIEYTKLYLSRTQEDCPADGKIAVGGNVHEPLYLHYVSRSTYRCQIALIWKGSLFPLDTPGAAAAIVSQTPSTYYNNIFNRYRSGAGINYYDGALLPSWALAEERAVWVLLQGIVEVIVTLISERFRRLSPDGVALQDTPGSEARKPFPPCFLSFNSLDSSRGRAVYIGVFIIHDNEEKEEYDRNFEIRGNIQGRIPSLSLRLQVPNVACLRESIEALAVADLKKVKHSASISTETIDTWLGKLIGEGKSNWVVDNIPVDVASRLLCHSFRGDVPVSQSGPISSQFVNTDEGGTSGLSGVTLPVVITVEDKRLE